MGELIRFPIERTKARRELAAADRELQQEVERQILKAWARRGVRERLKQIRSPCTCGWHYDIRVSDGCPRHDGETNPIYEPKTY